MLLEQNLCFFPLYIFIIRSVQLFCFQSTCRSGSKLVKLSNLCIFLALNGKRGKVKMKVRKVEDFYFFYFLNLFNDDISYSRILV